MEKGLTKDEVKEIINEFFNTLLSDNAVTDEEKTAYAELQNNLLQELEKRDEIDDKFIQSVAVIFDIILSGEMIDLQTDIGLLNNDLKTASRYFKSATKLAAGVFDYQSKLFKNIDELYKAYQNNK